MRTVAFNPVILPPLAKQFSATMPLCAGRLRADMHFRAGRHCALAALGALDPSRAPATLERGPRRAPLWPSWATGSITHTDGFASAAVAPTSLVRALGIDSELIAIDDRDPVAHLIATSDEVTQARRAILSDPAAVTLIFSMKESIFKCLYPVTGRFFEFGSVRLVDVDEDGGMFHAEMCTRLSEQLGCGTAVTGRFQFDAPWVHTGVCLSADTTTWL